MISTYLRVMSQSSATVIKPEMYLYDQDSKRPAAGKLAITDVTDAGFRLGPKL